LKAIPRKHVRESAVILALEASAAKASGNEISKAREDYLRKAHRREKEAEVSILAKLEWHPFIAGLIDTFYDSQNLYLALEYAPYGTLRTLLQRSSQSGMKSGDANFFFANILGGVDFLHIQGIAHRDLKPENILLNSDGYLCLTDFGSACSLGAIDESPKLGGTCAYMAPEWYHTDPKLLDWWSCGCILFEMATGKMVCPMNH
jgi:serine/threonine protein kinase